MSTGGNLLGLLGQALRSFLLLCLKAAGELLRSVVFVLAAIALMIGATLAFGTVGLLAVSVPLVLALLWRALRSPTGEGSSASDDGGGDGGGGD